MILNVVYFGLVNEYINEKKDPIKLEKDLNPILVATITIRLFTIFHSLLTLSYPLLLLGFVELGYNYYVSTRRPILLDATTIWKDINKIQLDSQIRVGYSVFLSLFSVIYLVITMVFLL
ncbi:hypothetical protein AGDE_11062 [Angomonas deanei]|nr:hypothetical protein AGDE_11062 [Angomonas deanei]|eukprot:EPY26847.1 hypothetical protein AGDE_11062 [Angomonas deanei]